MVELLPSQIRQLLTLAIYEKASPHTAYCNSCIDSRACIVLGVPPKPNHIEGGNKETLYAS